MIYFMFNKKSQILDIEATEIISSGSYPTIEAKVTLGSGLFAKASVPFGVSSGKTEASILLDNDKKRFHGQGMLKAVKNIEQKIRPLLKGQTIYDQQAIDRNLMELDGTENKSRLGANAILAVSLACNRLAAKASGHHLWAYLIDYYNLPQPKNLPQPMAVVIEGGRHADNSTDFQEYLLIPGKNNGSVASTLRRIIETYQTLKTILRKNGYSTNVGNEGAYAPEGISSNEKPLQFMLEAIKKSGYLPGKDISMALDIAASEFYKKKKYELACEKTALTAAQFIEYQKKLLRDYPLISIEDGLDQNDWEHWPQLFHALGKKSLIVGDDLTTTNSKRLKKAIKLQALNAMIVKPNQIGTITETIAAIQVCQRNGLEMIVSHRGGGETNDTYIVDLAVACGARYLKVGPTRGERVAKYNRLLTIEREEW